MHLVVTYVNEHKSINELKVLNLAESNVSRRIPSNLLVVNNLKFDR